MAARQGEKKGAIVGRTKECMGIGSQGPTRGVGWEHVLGTKLGVILILVSLKKSYRSPR
jgi:hypothetical protein